MKQDTQNQLMAIFAQAQLKTDKTTTPKFDTPKQAKPKVKRKPALSGTTVGDLLQPQPDTQKQPVNDLKIVGYSDKAFAVIGETKPIKSQLAVLGGKFNPHLKCGAGWIFSRKKLDDVQNLLNLKIDQP